MQTGCPVTELPVILRGDTEKQRNATQTKREGDSKTRYESEQKQEKGASG